MKTKGSDIFKGFFAIIFIFLLTAVFFHPVIFQGKTFYAFDTLLQHPPWSSEAPPNFRAQNPLITDPVNISYPFRQFFKSCLHSEDLFFWKDYNFCGTPADPPTHPILFLFYALFPLSAAHDLLLWIHLFATGLFMFLYLKETDLKTYPALIGAIAWMFNGYVMVWFEFENVILLAPSFAATLYFFERWLKTRKLFYCLCIIGAAAFSVSSGYAHMLIYQFFFLCFYFVYRIFQMRKFVFRNMDKGDLGGVALAILSGLCIFSSFIINNVSTLHEDSFHRQKYSFAEIYRETGGVPNNYLITLLFPDFFGNPARGGINFIPKTKGPQPYNNYNELCIYSGIGTIFLALVCIPYMGRRKYALFYFLTAIFTLSMAMGSILYYPMATFVPGLNLSTPTRILYFFGFSMAVLAAIGTDILTSNEKNKHKGIIISLWILLAGVAISLAIWVQTEAGIKWAANYGNWTDWDRFYPVLKDHFFIFSRVVLYPICLAVLSFLSFASVLFYKKERTKRIFLLLALLILSYDLISFGLFYNTASPRRFEYPETSAVRFLKKDTSAYRIITYGNFMHNSFAPFGIQDVGGYSSFYPKRYGEFLHLSQNGLDAPFPEKFSRWAYFKSFGSPLLDLISAKYALFPPSVSVNAPKLRLVYDDEIKIYENTEAFPRAFFVPDYQFCESRTDAYRAIGTYTKEDFSKKVVLESMPPEDFQQQPKSPDDLRSEIALVSHRPGRVEVKVSTNRHGFLVLSDNYHPDWLAKTDGEETDILRANYIMRAIPITPGDHKVLFIFQPSLRLGGFMLTILGWGILGFLLIFSLVKGIMGYRP